MTYHAISGVKSEAIRVTAKPEPVEIDVTKSVILVVDMQNDFGAKGGLLDRLGIDISCIQDAIEPIANVLSAARRAGIKIVYLKMGFLPDLSDLGAAGSPNRVLHLSAGVGESICAPDGTQSRILIRDTWNTEILPQLLPQPGDLVIYKQYYSGFYRTDLDANLAQMGVNSLIVTGCTTSVCVESTVRDAMFRGYHSLLLADCMAEPIGNDLDRSNHEASLLVIQRQFGSVSNSHEFIQALAAEAVALGQRG